MPHHPELETVIIFTARMQALAEFYRAAFELGPYTPSPGHLGQPVGPVYLGFDEHPEAGAGSDQRVTLWFTVDDLQASYDRLVGLGATARYPPTEKPWGARLAAVYDPDGNMIGLSQRRPKA